MARPPPRHRPRPDRDRDPGPDALLSRARVAPVGEALERRMTGSSHDPATCPLPLDRLRVLSVHHVGFDGLPRTGRIIVRASLARDVVQVFERLHDARWPLRRMRLVDACGGDDDRSTAADNTSG